MLCKKTHLNKTCFNRLCSSYMVTIVLANVLYLITFVLFSYLDFLSCTEISLGTAYYTDMRVFYEKCSWIDS